MTEVKTPELLTEADVRVLWAKSVKGPNDMISELRQRGLIAPEPADPLLIEAREIVKECTSYPNKGMVRIVPEEIALAALRRGMELAERKEAPAPSVPLTREMVDLVKWGIVDEAIKADSPHAIALSAIRLTHAAILQQMNGGGNG